MIVITFHPANPCQSLVQSGMIGIPVQTNPIELIIRHIRLIRLDRLLLDVICFHSQNSSDHPSTDSLPCYCRACQRPMHSRKKQNGKQVTMNGKRRSWPCQHPCHLFCFNSPGLHGEVEFHPSVFSSSSRASPLSSKGDCISSLCLRLFRLKHGQNMQSVWSYCSADCLHGPGN